MASLIHDAGDGLRAYSEALHIVRERRLWGYFILPGILSLLFGLLIIWLAYNAYEGTTGLIASWYPWQNARDIVTTLGAILGAILVIAVGLMIYKYVVLILVAPFMSMLSETVENHLRGRSNSVSFSLKRAAAEFVRGVRVALRNILREVLLTVVLLLMGLIPVIGLLSGPAIFLLQAYYAGFGNMDFTLERHLGVRQSAQFVRTYRGVAIGNGIVFLLVLAIPLAGLFVAPALATVTGT